MALLNKKIFSLIALTTVVIWSNSLFASCRKVQNTNLLSAEAIAAGYTATSWSGACDHCTGNPGLPAVISISSGNNFQPAGTLLASGIGNFLTASTDIPYSANQILYRCALADANNLYEMYATNGDSTYAGRYPVSDVDGAYYDPAKNVSVRVTNLSTGQYYTKYWQERKLTSDGWFQDSQYIYIPASIFSNALYEMIKTDNTEHYRSASSGNYVVDTYTQPRAYIAFKGPGLNTNSLQVGQDSGPNHSGFYENWPGGWSSYNAVTYVRGAFCKIRDYPAVVNLPMISISSLNNGGTSQSVFNVSIECEAGTVTSTAPSSTKAANVAMGFLVNNASAVNAALKLKLKTPAGGLTYLLDTNYGSQGVASGVGIKIYDANGDLVNLLPDLSVMGAGWDRGWYYLNDLTDFVSSNRTSIYSGSFTASLEKINGQTVTAGSVNAQLQVVVSFQ